MANRKKNIIEQAMHYHQIVILVTCALIAFGLYSLPNMRKNEFPDFTIRQGIVVAVAPGNTSSEMVDQIAKPLENYIFSYKEVRKDKTFSTSRDGITYIQVQLNDDLYNKDEFWSKFKHGISTFKSQLPQNVAAVQVMDDFGDTSALLITLESQDKTYRELDDYMDELEDRLRQIESVGRMTVYGMQQEQIAIYLDNRKLAQYGLSEQSLAATLFSKGFVTTGGKVQTPEYILPIHVEKSFNTVYDVQEQIVYSDPDGNTVRLKDIARVTKEYPRLESYIRNNGTKCLLLSVEMKKGQNIVLMGEEIDRVLAAFKQEVLPQEVEMFRISDQSQVVADSVQTFLRELQIAICAVVIVVMLLLPLRVALVAASTIPITIFISLGLFHAFGIELNTVTLAGLVVTLGMIVDNSIVIIDNYLEKIGEGKSRWHASIESTAHFLKSIFSATLAISITFFPFLLTMSGMQRDFILSFPWAMTLILGVSLLVASLLVPFLQFWFIRKPMQKREKGFSFLDSLQRYYDRILEICFRHPCAVTAGGVLSVAAGIFLMGMLPQNLMPTADRNQFAVEIYHPTGTAVEKTVSVADSLEHILRKDRRVVSVTSFIGCASPRFHTSYAPQIAGSHYAQFIVNTKGAEETVALLDEYAPRYANAFPGAFVRFKQLSYNEAVYPIELRLSGNCLDSLRRVADDYVRILRAMPQTALVQTDMKEPQSTARIVLQEPEAARLGVSNALLESTLALRYGGSGLPVANVWEGDYSLPIVLKSEHTNRADCPDIEDELIPVAGGLSDVPLRQIAQVLPTEEHGQIVRRNGVFTVSVLSDLQRGVNSTEANRAVRQQIQSVPLPEGVALSFGGDIESNEENMPGLLKGLSIAALVILFILILHFRKISIACLIFASLSLCLFGTAAGILVQGVDFSLTCFLGIVSLMGIIVRNGIIMLDYAEELRAKEKMCVRDAIRHSARRRMRPIFLTSAAASMGVIPMILGKSGLWMPMGTVICYGTLITMLFLLTVLPVAYLLLFRGTTKKRMQASLIENE